MARITNSSGGVVEDLLFRALTPRDTDREFWCDWYVLNLENSVIMTLSRMPEEARLRSTAVACSNQIFVLGGVCRRNSTCPDERRDCIEVHGHGYVFSLNYDDPEDGWGRPPPMLSPRIDPCAVALDGVIYVFGGSCGDHFAEFFKIKENSWKILPLPPSAVDPDSISDSVLADSPRSRILVHFACNNSLYAYSVDLKSWQCLDENFGKWPTTKSVIVEDVLYYLVEIESREEYLCFSEKECSLRAYHVVEKKHLLVKWLPKFEVWVPSYADLYHLGNGTMCLVEFLYTGRFFAYMKFSVSKNSGEVYATAEPEPVTIVPFETGFFVPPML